MIPITPTPEKAKELQTILDGNGIIYGQHYFISKSKTDFGESWYFKFYASDFRDILKIRVSDHSVLSGRRILDEVHYNGQESVNRAIEVIKSYIN